MWIILTWVFNSDWAKSVHVRPADNFEAGCLLIIYTFHVPSLDFCCVNNVGCNARETGDILVVKSLVDGCILDVTGSAKCFKRTFERKRQRKIGEKYTEHNIMSS